MKKLKWIAANRTGQGESEMNEWGRRAAARISIPAPQGSACLILVP